MFIGLPFISFNQHLHTEFVCEMQLFPSAVGIMLESQGTQCGSPFSKLIVLLSSAHLHRKPRKFEKHKHKINI